MAGFFFVLTIWLQAGEGFAPRVGADDLAFSAGTIVFAGVPQRLDPPAGRYVLVVGGLLMAAGSVSLSGRRPTAARRSAGGTSPWDCSSRGPDGPACHPLANVIISAIPAPSAGAASGGPSTAQQLGGAIGIGVFGAIFFGALPASGFLPSFVETGSMGRGRIRAVRGPRPHPTERGCQADVREIGDKAGGCQVGAAASTRREAVEDAASQVIAPRVTDLDR